MRSCIILIVVATAAVVTCLATAAPAHAPAHMREEVLLGEWRTITDINNPGIQNIGEWAVAAYVKLTSMRFKFVKVVSGQMQLVEGVNYRLEIVTQNLVGGQKETYLALVYDHHQGQTDTRRLISFVPAN